MLVFIYSPRSIGGGVTCTLCKATFTPLPKKMGVGVAFNQPDLGCYCAPSTGLRTSEVSITYSFLMHSQSSHSSHFPNKGAERKKGAKLLA